MQNSIFGAFFPHVTGLFPRQKQISCMRATQTCLSNLPRRQFIVLKWQLPRHLYCNASPSPNLSLPYNLSQSLLQIRELHQIPMQCSTRFFPFFPLQLCSKGEGSAMGHAQVEFVYGTKKQDLSFFFFMSFFFFNHFSIS